MEIPTTYWALYLISKVTTEVRKDFGSEHVGFSVQEDGTISCHDHDKTSEVDIEELEGSLTRHGIPFSEEELMREMSRGAHQ